MLAARPLRMHKERPIFILIGGIAMSVRLVHTLARESGVTRASEGAFIRLRDQSILFAYCRFSGTGQGYDDDACDLYALRSGDEGESWSTPFPLIKAEAFGVKNIMSVSLMRMQNDDLGVFFLIKQNDGASSVALARSRDEGESFYRYSECTLRERRAYYVINNDRIERLANGRLVIPIAFHRGGFVDGKRPFVDGRSIAVCLLSDDDGESWREACDLIYPPFQDTSVGLQEPGVIALKDSLFLYARTDKFCQYGAYSFDGGEHWTGAFPTRFSSPCSPMKIARNPFDGALYAVWNPIPNYCGREIVPGCGGRTPLVYAVSRDEGVSWSAPQTIESAPDHGYCYPALFFTRDESLLLSYCAGGPEDGHCLTRTNMTKVRL